MIQYANDISKNKVVNKELALLAKLKNNSTVYKIRTHTHILYVILYITL